MDGYYTSVIIANESNRESQFDQLVAHNIKNLFIG